VIRPLLPDAVSGPASPFGAAANPGDTGQPAKTVWSLPRSTPREFFRGCRSLSHPEKGGVRRALTLWQIHDVAGAESGGAPAAVKSQANDGA
jgi:hypothetical protein